MEKSTQSCQQSFITKSVSILVPNKRQLTPLTPCVNLCNYFDRLWLAKLSNTLQESIFRYVVKNTYKLTNFLINIFDMKYYLENEEYFWEIYWTHKDHQRQTYIFLSFKIQILQFLNGIDKNMSGIYDFKNVKLFRVISPVIIYYLYCWRYHNHSIHQNKWQ